MTSLIKIPFADSGDKTTVPATDSGGGVNMTQGYGQAYSLDPATDPSAKRIERQMMNGLFNLITKAIQEIQSSGVAPFITTADNGGSPFSYAKGAIVSLSGATYQSLNAGNTTTPPGANWAEVRNAGNGLQRSDPFGDIKLDGASAIAAALANLGLKTAAQRDVGTGTNQIPDMASFTGSKSANGWQKLPGGLILQWGNAAPTSGSTNINFPIAFPQNPYFVGVGYRQANFPTAMQSIIVNDTTLTTTGCTVRNLQYDGTSMIASASAFFWFAIG